MSLILFKIGRFLRWVRNEGYYKSFFTSIFAALAFAIALDLRGFEPLSALSNFIVWLEYLIVFIIVFLFGAVILYFFDG